MDGLPTRQQVGEAKREARQADGAKRLADDYGCARQRGHSQEEGSLPALPSGGAAPPSVHDALAPPCPFPTQTEQFQGDGPQVVPPKLQKRLKDKKRKKRMKKRKRELDKLAVLQEESESSDDSLTTLGSLASDLDDNEEVCSAASEVVVAVPHAARTPARPLIRSGSQAQAQADRQAEAQEAAAAQGTGGKGGGGGEGCGGAGGEGDGGEAESEDVHRWTGRREPA